MPSQNSLTKVYDTHVLIYSGRFGPDCVQCPVGKGLEVWLFYCLDFVFLWYGFDCIKCPIAKVVGALLWVQVVFWPVRKG